MLCYTRPDSLETKAPYKFFTYLLTAVVRVIPPHTTSAFYVGLCSIELPYNTRVWFDTSFNDAIAPMYKLISTKPMKPISDITLAFKTKICHELRLQCLAIEVLSGPFMNISVNYLLQYISNSESLSINQLVWMGVPLEYWRELLLLLLLLGQSRDGAHHINMQYMSSQTSHPDNRHSYLHIGKHITYTSHSSQIQQPYLSKTL